MLFDNKVDIKTKFNTDFISEANKKTRACTYIPIQNKC